MEWIGVGIIATFEIVALLLIYMSDKTETKLGVLVLQLLLFLYILT